MQKKLQQLLQTFDQCTYTKISLSCLHMTCEVYNAFVCFLNDHDVVMLPVRCDCCILKYMLNSYVSPPTFPCGSFGT